MNFHQYLQKRRGCTSTISNSSFRRVSHVFTVGDIDATKHLITTIEKTKKIGTEGVNGLYSHKGRNILQSSFLRAQFEDETIDFVHKDIALPVQKFSTGLSFLLA